MALPAPSGFVTLNPSLLQLLQRGGGGGAGAGASLGASVGAPAASGASQAIQGAPAAGSVPGTAPSPLQSFQQMLGLLGKANQATKMGGQLLNFGPAAGGGGVNPSAFAPEAAQGGLDVAGMAPTAGMGIASGLTGAATGLLSHMGQAPPKTQGQAFMNTGLDLLGALTTIPTLGMGPGIASALENILRGLFRPHIPHAVRENKEAFGAASGESDLINKIHTARTLDELNTAFGDMRQRIGGITGGAYPLGQGFNLADPTSTLQALQGGHPQFGYQVGISGDKVQALNQRLNQEVQQQISLINAAAAGDPQAQQRLAQLRQEGGTQVLGNDAEQLVYTDPTVGRNLAGGMLQRAQGYGTPQTSSLYQQLLAASQGQIANPVGDVTRFFTA